MAIPPGVGERPGLDSGGEKKLNVGSNPTFEPTPPDQACGTGALENKALQFIPSSLRASSLTSVILASILILTGSSLMYSLNLSIMSSITSG